MKVKDTWVPLPYKRVYVGKPLPFGLWITRVAHHGGYWCLAYVKERPFV
jgi:hypothetical protein